MCILSFAKESEFLPVSSVPRISYIHIHIHVYPIYIYTYIHRRIYTNMCVSTKYKS